MRFFTLNAISPCLLLPQRIRPQLVHQVALLCQLVLLSHQPSIVIFFLHLDAFMGHSHSGTEMLEVFDLLLARAPLLVKSAHLSFDLILGFPDLLLHSFYALLALEHVLVIGGQALQLLDVSLDLSLLAAHFLTLRVELLHRFLHLSAFLQQTSFPLN